MAYVTGQLGRRRRGRLRGVLVLAGVLVLLLQGCTGSAGERGRDGSADARRSRCTGAEDCLGRMTLREKAGQMTQVSAVYVKDKPEELARYGIGSVLSAVDGGPKGTGGTGAQWAGMVDGYQRQAMKSRLGIPLLYGVDAVHGHNMVQGTTLFPHHIGMGATRDPELVRRAEDVTRREVLGTGIRWAFTPCVCVPRDDRWGRTYEGYGEDPATVSPLGAAAVRGIQGPRLDRDSVLATAKHFVGDGGTSYGSGDNGFRIDRGDSRMSEAELRRVHLPPFRAAVEAGAGSVMVTYSSWNGDKVHGERYLVNDVLKEELGFRGIVVSDLGGVKEIDEPTYTRQVVRAVNSGIDMIMVPDKYRATIDAITAGVRDGRIPEARVDDAVRRILAAKFSLDLFKHPYGDRTYTKDIGSTAHRAVAREAVRRSQVLLKNSGGALPLARSGRYRIALGGAGADDLGMQLGGWSVSWQGMKGRTTTGTTLRQALRKATAGSGITLRNAGADTAGDYRAEVGIWAGGERPYAEGHGDSKDLGFGAENARQLKALCARVKVCVAVLYSGRPLIITDQLPEVDAFVASWLPGTEAEGITDVLFGKGFSGRLPVSWPRSVADEPINSGDGKRALFPAGYGISPY